MAITDALARKRGNPNWRRPIPSGPAVATEFERRVNQLQFPAEMYISSAELRACCERNRNRRYVPEWLLKEWDNRRPSKRSGIACRQKRLFFWNTMDSAAALRIEFPVCLRL